MHEVENFLAHYGKIGMKWGRRSGRSVSSDYTSSTKLRKKGHKQLSNEELKSAIGRMQLEKQYKDLNPKGFSLANKWVASALAVGVTVNSAIAFKNSAAGSAIIKAVETKLGK